jgi:hypothetical protein
LLSVAANNQRIMAHQANGLARFSQVFSPEQLRQLHEHHAAVAASHQFSQQPVEFMQNHGVGYVFGDWSQPVGEDDPIQADSLEQLPVRRREQESP